MEVRQNSARTSSLRNKEATEICSISAEVRQDQVVSYMLERGKTANSDRNEGRHQEGSSILCSYGCKVVLAARLLLPVLQYLLFLRIGMQAQELA